MSTKTFCDCCGSDMSEQVKARNPAERPVALHGETWIGNANGGSNFKMTLDISFSLNGCSNLHDVCHHCIIDAVRRLDDRPSPL